MAGRKPYRKMARGKFLAFYILWEGRQTWLGRFEKEANDNLERLKAGKPVVRPVAEPVSDSPTVQELVDSYMDHRRKGTASTYEWYQATLKFFSKEFGALKANILKPQAVTDWINSHKTWGSNMRHSAGRAVVAVFNHAMANDDITVNPLAKFKKERATAREGAELAPDEWSRLATAVQGWDFETPMRFMRLTGCRPLECRSIEARHFIRGTITFPKSESKGKRSERVIRLAGESLEIIQKLVIEHPAGPLFLDSRGLPWTQESFSRRCKKLGKLCNVPQFICYGLRHTYATEAIISGLDSLIVARLMGHSNIAMLQKIYAKHGERGDFMAEQALKAVAGV